MPISNLIVLLSLSICTKLTPFSMESKRLPYYRRNPNEDVLVLALSIPRVPFLIQRKRKEESLEQFQRNVHYRKRGAQLSSTLKMASSLFSPLKDYASFHAKLHCSIAGQFSRKRENEGKLIWGGPEMNTSVRVARSSQEYIIPHSWVTKTCCITSGFQARKKFES